MKKRWVIPLMLIVVMAVSVMGSYAYFQAQRTATSTVRTGTLGIVIAASPDMVEPPNSAFGDTATPWSFDNMAPGDVRSGCLWLMNTGTLGTARAYWNFTTLSTLPGPGNLADRLEVTHALTTDSWFDWIPSMQHTGWDPNNDGIITLQEIANYGGDWMSDVVPFVETAPGGKGAICMTFKMINGTPAEDNPFQGQTLTYNALVTAQNPAAGVP
jgi:predicted ribosomally synthesized peptide with SipW-like signal peptide